MSGNRGGMAGRIPLNSHPYPFVIDAKPLSLSLMSLSWCEEEYNHTRRYSAATFDNDLSLRLLLHPDQIANLQNRNAVVFF